MNDKLKLALYTVIVIGLSVGINTVLQNKQADTKTVEMPGNWTTVQSGHKNVTEVDKDLVVNETCIRSNIPTVLEVETFKTGKFKDEDNETIRYDIKKKVSVFNPTVSEVSYQNFVFSECVYKPEPAEVKALYDGGNWR